MAIREASRSDCGNGGSGGEEGEGEEFKARVVGAVVMGILSPTIEGPSRGVAGITPLTLGAGGEIVVVGLD